MSPELEAAIAKLVEKGEALAQARSEEQRLEDERPLLKELAIIRIMARDGSAATRAEKIVESDQEYMAHRIAQRGSVVARFKADAEYWAAKCEATQASLITPDVFALESENSELTISVLNANDKVNEYAGTVTFLREENARLRGEIEGRTQEMAEVVSANRSLLLARNEARDANAELVQANRELAEQNERSTRESNNAIVGRA